MAIYNQGHQIKLQSTCLGPNQLVYNRELEGITQAIELASTRAKPDEAYFIYSESQASLSRLRTVSDDPGQSCLIRAINAANTLVSKGATISLNWVPGHTYIVGNELADKLAKSGTTKRPSSYITSYGVLSSTARKLSNSQGQMATKSYFDQPKKEPTISYSRFYSPNIRARIQLPKGVKRDLASAFYLSTKTRPWLF